MDSLGVKPKCKLCGSPHWTYEEHKLTGTEELQKLGAGVLNPAIPAETIPVRVRATIVDYVPTPPPDVPTTVPTCEVCGKRPREGRYKVCSACRKAAYRERSRG